MLPGELFQCSLQWRLGSPAGWSASELLACKPLQKLPRRVTRRDLPHCLYLMTADGAIAATDPRHVDGTVPSHPEQLPLPATLLPEPRADPKLVAYRHAGTCIPAHPGCPTMPEYREDSGSSVWEYALAVWRMPRGKGTARRGGCSALLQRRQDDASSRIHMMAMLLSAACSRLTLHSRFTS
ncbi:hypothetical protein EJ04DRAFT_247228 [Polyplosphaeria fusca]|uniref:Uncharacterized protein n=1 Tax=Polyplosphaeria fusca TaxID=682080 RepID=A0A9P4R0M0_9PLEO|nr:hypothetical protein EJ04DRAFT_247228 [Polyplosphaeria fusca]